MNQKVESFDLTGGQKVSYGYFSGLEIILKHFSREVESYLFDQFQIACHLDYKIRAGVSFQSYTSQVAQPLPMIMMDFSALEGKSLLVMENRLANLFLFQDTLRQSRKARVSNRFELNSQNQEPLRKATLDLMNLFAGSVSELEEATCDLDKLVSHRIKARCMQPEESCVLVEMQVQCNQFQSSFTFCFSAYQLDHLLKRLSKKAMLYSSITQPKREPTPQWLKDLIEAKSTFEASGILGTIQLSQQDLMESYHQGKVLPIENHLSMKVQVSLGEEPILAAELGSSHGNLALQVSGVYEEARVKEQNKPAPFAKFQFPGSPAKA